MERSLGVPGKGQTASRAIGELLGRGRSSDQIDPS